MSTLFKTQVCLLSEDQLDELRKNPNDFRSEVIEKTICTFADSLEEAERKFQKYVEKTNFKEIENNKII